jgi:hypothetical protein
VASEGRKMSGRPPHGKKKSPDLSPCRSVPEPRHRCAGKGHGFSTRPVNPGPSRDEPRCIRAHCLWMRASGKSPNLLTPDRTKPPAASRRYVFKLYRRPPQERNPERVLSLSLGLARMRLPQERHPQPSNRNAVPSPPACLGEHATPPRPAPPYPRHPRNAAPPFQKPIVTFRNVTIHRENTAKRPAKILSIPAPSPPS